ncbi:hypothetical protein Igag_0672 [Ignisphaera aggregans DSM 17230]|uniref:Uncharacterized protein n=1 Tax=Ignisphaera aggregans (strain DSM 17230 / JCM 13409 / AQ1.S1) TaxID=583356 RepID=E0SSV3_IGNAA|nr:hypothetical protein Igag_0672 [Ignisphaera aggregans DSM 17230]
MKIGESYARMILAIGAYEDIGIEPTYKDIARATNRSLSRVRTAANKIMKEGLAIKVSENPVKLKLTEKGREIYKQIRSEIVGQIGNAKVYPSQLIKKFDEKLYEDYRRIRFFGDVAVSADVVVSKLKLPEVVKALGERFGPALLFGYVAELATAVQIASASAIGSIPFNSLSKQIINAPIRVARVTDVALPPHMEGTVIPLERAVRSLSFVSLWPNRTSYRDVKSYAEEADALGLIRMVKGLQDDEVFLEPRLKTGIDVVEKISTIGFDTLTAVPSRAWIPMLTIYGDITTRFPTLQELQSAETPMLSVIRDIVGLDRIEKWVNHVLGIKKSMKVPALTMEAPYDTFGVVKLIKISDEQRLLTLTVARRIVGEALQEDSFNLNSVYSRAEERIRRVLVDSGIYGEILKEFIREGFIGSEEAERIIKKYVDENPIVILKDFESLGFIQPVGFGYYSAWTITPLHHNQNETIRTLLAWLAKELRSLGRDEEFNQILYENVLRNLIERGEVNISTIQPYKALVRVARSLTTLEKMGIVKFEGDEVVKVTDNNARRLLMQAYIEHRLGLGLALEPYEKQKKPKLDEIVAEIVVEK